MQLLPSYVYLGSPLGKLVALVLLLFTAVNSLDSLTIKEGERLHYNNQMRVFFNLPYFLSNPNN